MTYVLYALCLIGAALVAYGILDENTTALIAGAVLVLACAAAGWLRKRSQQGGPPAA